MLKQSQTASLRVTVLLTTSFAVLMLAQTRQPFAAEGLAPRTGASVSVSKVSKRCFPDTLAVTGVLVPKEEIYVRPEREGLQISQILVEEGDRVTAGQGLIKLTQPDTPVGAPPGAPPGAAAAPGPVTLQAPVAGTVRRVAATVGTMASLRAEPLVMINGGGDIELQADAVPKQLAKIAPGQQTKISIVGAGEVAGQVRLRAATIDPMTQLGQVRITVNDSQRFHVGTFARAVIVAGQSCGVAVPMSALLYGDDGSVVQSVRDGRVETRKVTVGLFSNNDVEIREGVNEGDIIVSRAGAFLRDGDRVSPVYELAPR